MLLGWLDATPTRRCRRFGWSWRCLRYTPDQLPFIPQPENRKRRDDEALDVLLSLPGTMNRTKRLTGVCSECGGSIEFPAEMIGATATCPRCRKQTELRLASPPAEPSVPRKAIVWTVVTALILVAGLVATLVGLKHFEKLAARQRDRAPGAPGKKCRSAAGP